MHTIQGGWVGAPERAGCVCARGLALAAHRCVHERPGLFLRQRRFDGLEQVELDDGRRAEPPRRWQAHLDHDDESVDVVLVGNPRKLRLSGKDGEDRGRLRHRW
eukprot:scaffold2111_cov130-Isochrysis_galbana.AAC.2